jgi:hypothetical protein
MLLNIVKIRYADAPVFLEVTSIISQYALETEFQASASWNAFLPTVYWFSVNWTDTLFIKRLFSSSVSRKPPSAELFYQVF